MRRTFPIIAALVFFLQSAAPAQAAGSSSSLQYPTSSSSLSAAASSANCTISAYRPVKDGSYLWYQGWQFCTAFVDQYIDIELRRWTGSVWQLLSTGHTAGWIFTDSLRTEQAWNCAGQGTQTYRTYARGYFIDQTGYYESPWIASPSTRTFC